MTVPPPPPRRRARLQALRPPTRQHRLGAALTLTDARGHGPSIVPTLKLPPEVSTRNYCMIKFPRPQERMIKPMLSTKHTPDTKLDRTKTNIRSLIKRSGATDAKQDSEDPSWMRTTTTTQQYDKGRRQRQRYAEQSQNEAHDNRAEDQKRSRKGYKMTTTDFHF